MERVTAVIVAGGSGKRMGMAIKKQYILLKDKEILAHTLEAFNICDFINEIIVVVSKEEIEYVQENIIDKYRFSKVKKIVSGGAERQDSVYNGLLAVSEETKYVMIHDGARPFIKKEVLYNALERAKQTGASIVAVPVKDTIKICNSTTSKVEATPSREQLWSVQTPQTFERSLLLEAYAFAKEKALKVTDDSMLLEAFGKDVYIVEGDYTNIKVTTPEDLLIGKAILNDMK